MYCKIRNEQVVNVAVIDSDATPEWAAENGYEWIDPPIGQWWVRIDGVWREKTLAAKSAELDFYAATRANDLQDLYKDDTEVWNGLTQEQKDRIDYIINWCNNVSSQDGYPWLDIPDKEF